MSTSEPLDRRVEPLAEPWDEIEGRPLRSQGPQVATAIVPQNSIAGRSLTAVVAIMTFLAALTAGAVMMVVSAASDWRSDVGREVTVQVRPVAGRDLEADVRKAADITGAVRGVADVRVYTKEESARLVEPWLGNGLALDELPMPRMIVVKLWNGAPPDFAALRKTLAAQVPSASLDDHRRWIDRMRTMAGTAVAGGVAILLMVLLGDHPFGYLRDARRHGDKPADRRSAALRRRHRRICGQPVSAPFPQAWVSGRHDRRRRGDRVVWRAAGSEQLAHGYGRRRRGRGLVRHVLHWLYRLSGDSRADCADGSGDRAGFTPDRQAHPENDRLTSGTERCAKPSCCRNCRYYDGRCGVYAGRLDDTEREGRARRWSALRPQCARGE